MRFRTRVYVPLAVAAALAVAPSWTLAASREPLCDWLSGVADAAQAQASGDAPAAEAAAHAALLARPRGLAAARAQAALGLALLSRDDPRDAAEALEVALGVPVPARAYLAFARGEALERSKDAPAAARLFGEAASASGDLALAPRARLHEAQALLAAGLAVEAVPTLQALLGATGDSAFQAAARIALARGLRALGQDEVSVGVFRTLWLEMPERAEARTAAAELAAWRNAGGPVPPDSGRDHVIRAEKLLADGWPDDALLELDAAARADEPAADPERAALLRAGALLALGRHAEAERTALPLAGAASDDVQRGARLVLARTAARAGRVEEASRFYTDVATSTAPVPGLPESRQRDIGDESGFLSAWLFYDAGRFVPAIAALEAFARTHPRSRRAEDALWFAAWSRYRLGRAAQADRAFAALSRSALADGALYWRARLSRSPERQRALYRSVAALGGMGWYALLARARLTALGDRPALPAVAPAGPIPEVQDARAAARLSVAVELLALGLREPALEELRDLGRGAHARTSAAAVAQLAAFLGDAELPFRMARDQLALTRRTMRWAYPEPHSALLAPSARGFGVDPALLLAIMRRESSFRQEVRSVAGAEGLLQLRPVTAERLASLLRVPGGVGLRLAEPGVGIGLGAHYLGLLQARFAEPVVAVAAYNAGPRPVAEWASARAGMPLDAWVESIPYRETRQYVKVVAANWDAYRRLAGEPPASMDPQRKVVPAGAGVAF